MNIKLVPLVTPEQIDNLKSELALVAEQLSTKADATLVATINQAVNALHQVASSGDYRHLTNRPTIPTVPEAVSAFENDANYLSADQVSKVGLSGNYNDLSNRPTIPAAVNKVSQLQNDLAFIQEEALTSALSPILARLDSIEAALAAIEESSE